MADIDVADGKSAALEARYGAAVPPAGPWNDVIALLHQHRSVRGYRPDALPKGTLETLVAAAQSAATSSNLQTWSVVAITDAGCKARLARIAGNQKHIEQCPLFLAWIADLSRLERVGQAAGKTMEGLPYLEMFMIALIDAALAAQNAVTAAESLGLSTVYIGALRNDPEAVAGELALPRQAMACFGLCVGYATPQAAGEVKPRLPQAAVLHHEQYRATHEAAVHAEYDQILATFSQRHEMAQASWSERVIARVGKVGGLMGRDRMRGALKALGWELK